MNWSHNTAIVVIGLVILTAACSSGDDAQADTSSGDAASTSQGQAAARTYTLQQEVPMAIFVTTTALKYTGFLQKEFTCEGSNASPYLGWEGAPEGTQSYAIVAEDVDAEEGEFAHWLIWGIPAASQSFRPAPAARAACLLGRWRA